MNSLNPDVPPSTPQHLNPGEGADLIAIIQSQDPAVRDMPLDEACRNLTVEQLLDWCNRLEQFRLSCTNLYERVRALFFLYSIHRFQLPKGLAKKESGKIPVSGYENLLARRFREAIRIFWNNRKSQVLVSP